MFFTSFSLIFLAALPGRTTFLLIALSANQKIRNLALGACAAFLVQAVISVLLGQALSFVPPAILHLCAGLLFLYFARKLWRESNESSTQVPVKQSIRSVFVLIFLAECGDVSQLAIASVAATADHVVTVFGAAIAALWSLTFIAILAGRTVARLLRPAVVQRCASFIFAALGIFLITSGLRFYLLFTLQPWVSGVS